MHSSMEKVHRSYAIRFRSASLSSTKCVKSLIVGKVKKWLKKFHQNVETMRSKNFNDVITERDNANNENKLNVVKSKMTWTIEELKDVVDDNLENELRELENENKRF